jgi:hypothetical protein
MRMYRGIVAAAIIFCFGLSARCADSLSAEEKMNQAGRLTNEGKILRDEGKLQESKALLEKACLFDPNENSGVAHENLALTLQKIGDLEAAKEQYLIGLRLDPNRPLILYNLANCYSLMGDIDHSVECWKGFLKNDPNGKYSDIARRVLASLENTPHVRDDPNASDYFADAIAVTNKITRWPVKKQPIKVFIDGGESADGYQPSFRQTVIDAFDKWIGCCDKRLSWKLVTNKQNADVSCRWVSDRSDFLHPAGAEVGETCIKYSPDPMHNNVFFIISADISFCTRNLDKSYVTFEEMQFICLHEIGHVLGIVGHSANNNDVMFYREKSHPVIDLSDRDKATLVRLYSAK